jgi:hypothetical protein
MLQVFRRWMGDFSHFGHYIRAARATSPDSECSQMGKLAALKGQAIRFDESSPVRQTSQGE